MEKDELKILVKEIAEKIKTNKKLLTQAINQELSKGNSIEIEKIEKALKEFDISEDSKKENKSIAVCYLGNPEITITYILDSMMHNNKITLCINEYKIVNNVLISFVFEAMKKNGIKNQWINYNSNYNEIYLRDNEKKFHKIVYIGDYFEYERFKRFFKNKNVEYNNFGYIKLFIDKSKNKEEYKKIAKYIKQENLYLEEYDDVLDLIRESKKEDYTILYLDDFKIINKIQKELKSKDVLINNFPYDDYKFKINR